VFPRQLVQQGRDGAVVEGTRCRYCSMGFHVRGANPRDIKENGSTFINMNFITIQLRKL
jgi:hypothetical protein